MVGRVVRRTNTHGGRFQSISMMERLYLRHKAWRMDQPWAGPRTAKCALASSQQVWRTSDHGGKATPPAPSSKAQIATVWRL